MRAYDLVSGIALLTLSIMICLGASRLNIGSFNNPGAGFFPFFLGMALGFLSILIIVMTKFEKRVAMDEQKLWSGAREPKKVLYILLALVCYGLLMEKFGYTLTTFLLFIFLLRVISLQNWYIVIGGALFASVGTYAVFELGLHMNLPQGFLGFLGM